MYLNDRAVGHDQPIFIIAEIGINHNGSLDLALRLMDAAKQAGCDAVKFQKRTPDLCVPEEMRDVVRETPWGTMSYLEYRERVEFGESEYASIDQHAKKLGIMWLASPWDLPSVEFLEHFNPACHKIPSAHLTNEVLVGAVVSTGRPTLLSTGMSTIDEIEAAATQASKDRLILLHCTSTYPCPPDELNLRVISTLSDTFDVPIGYSGHEVGLQTTLAAVALGACVVERHITLDRSMWGSDQAASVEPHGFQRLVRDIRVLERALGDGVKRVFPSEEEARKRLRMPMPQS